MPFPTPSSRYSSQISYSFLIWMVVFAVVTAAFGIYYSVLKSNQVAVRTEINKIRREIAVCRMNTNQYNAETNAQTYRWAMRDRLSQDGSSLRDIERSQIEVARTLRDHDRIHSTAHR